MSDVSTVELAQPEVKVPPVFVVYSQEIKPINPEVVGAIKEAKVVFDYWVSHYLSERNDKGISKWPMQSILIWSTGQTLNPVNSKRYKMNDNNGKYEKEISQGIITYLYDQAGAKEGVKNWVRDRQQEDARGSLDKRLRPLMEAAKEIVSEHEVNEKLNNLQG
jgi:hypothetical protein